MSDYKFLVKQPSTLKDQGITFVLNHFEFPDVLNSYNVSVPLPPPPSIVRFVHPNLDTEIKGTLKRQKVWKRLGEVRKIGTKQSVTVTESLTQSLTESRSLRALIKAVVGVETSGPFVSASAELTAEVEGTIEL